MLVRLLVVISLAKFGIERAASKLNHSSTKVTKDHYVVPEDKDNEIENMCMRAMWKDLEKSNKIVPVLLWANLLGILLVESMAANLV